MNARSLVIVAAAAASLVSAPLLAVTPAHAADYGTEVTFAASIDGARWEAAAMWDVVVTVRDTVVGQTLAGNNNCTTGVGTVHFSYSTSRGRTGTLPDDCVDLHGTAFAILPDAVRLALVPGEVVTFSASFTATEASSYSSSTTPGTARVTAVATQLDIDLYEENAVATSTSIEVETYLQPYAYDGLPATEGPAGTWTVRIETADGTEVARDTHAGGETGMMLDWLFDGLTPDTAYTVFARFDVAASDLGRRLSPAPVELDVETLPGPPAADDATVESEIETDPEAEAAESEEAESADLEIAQASANSPVLPIAISVVVLLAGATIALLLLRSRRTIG
jgi:hypothetical protein